MTASKVDRLVVARSVRERRVCELETQRIGETQRLFDMGFGPRKWWRSLRISTTLRPRSTCTGKASLSSPGGLRWSTGGGVVDNAEPTEGTYEPKPLVSRRGPCKPGCTRNHKHR